MNLLSFLTDKKPAVTQPDTDPNRVDIQPSEVLDRLIRFQKAKPPKYRPGGWVKTQFDDPEGNHPPEHMWVRVEGEDAYGLTGTLDSEPRSLTHTKYGDRWIVPLNAISQYIPPSPH